MKKPVTSLTIAATSRIVHFAERWMFLICLGLFLMLMDTAFAGQGVQRILYTVPNASFIENPSGDTGVVTINDTSGSISTLQTSINNARSSNPDSIIVINLKRGATYSVSSTSLTLGSQECLIASGALIKAADSSVTVPLVLINSGSTNVSIAGGTFDGNNANIQAIYAPAAARVNVDKVVARNCGQDCILLKGKGNTTYDNEMTVTRCDVSGSPAHAGISIQSSTQTAVLDNDCHDSSIGIYLSCAWANVANNTCEGNTTGIDVAGGNDNVVANNTCNNNGTGILVAGSKNMITGNAVSANTTAGISSTGSTDYFLYNSFGSDGANGANFSNGGTGDSIIAWQTSLSASGQNYFYPPLIDNQHNTTIENGMGRTDLTISSTSISSVQSQYNSALSAHPNDVIVLHLNGTFTVGSAPLTLQSDTCVLLNGTIQINSSTTAAAAIVTGASAARISISGGTIDCSSLTGHEGIDMTNNNSMICIDDVTIQNFGDNSTSHPGSDAIHFSGGSSPSMVTRCTINKAGSRGLWAGTSNQKILYEDNYVALTRAGLDCDYHTVGAVSIFNTYVNNTYGLWYEQGAQHNTGIGNLVTNSARDNLDAGNLNQSQITAYNNFICNVAAGSGNGLINSAGSDGNTFTSHNFFFNNVILNAKISSDSVGTENYYSQNYQSGGSLTTGSAASYFNSPDVDGFLQIRDSNSGLAVAVQGASTANGAAIVTADSSSMGDGSGDDEWQFIPTDSGFYKVINQNSGLAMVVAGASLTNGAPIIQYAYAGGSTYNDEWYIQSVGNGLYNFVNRQSELFLDVKGASLTPGTQLDQWPSNGGANQQFALVEDAISTTTPDFSISASPSSQSVVSGSGTSYTVTITATNGFNSSVGLTVSGLPTGATGTFNPTSVTGSGTSTLSVSTSTSTPAGSYTLTITGTSGSLQHSTTVSLVVEDFTIAASPSSQTVTAGNSTNYTATVGSVNGFSGTVTLSASGLPTGASANFNPASVNGAGSSTMTVTTLTSTPAGTNTIAVKGTSGSLSHTDNVTLIVKASSGGSLPSGWTDADVGNVGLAGSASYSSGTFTISGSGADIWNAGDQFNYAYQSVSGDQTVIARVVSENGTASYAKAGVMIRESLATNSVEASVLLTPTNGVAMEIRPSTGATSINVVNWVKGPVPPQWVKLSRSGSTFIAFYSNDGSTWTQFASTNVTMATGAIAGLAVTSHDNTSLNTASFDNVTIASTATLSPIADAFVRDGTYAANNYGSATNLDMKKSSTSYNRITFLKFDLTGVSSVSSAKLRLYGAFVDTTGTSPVTAHQQTDNSWTETGITWNNMPAAGAAITTVNVSTNLQYWEWDITSYVQAQKNGGATQITIQLQNDTSTTQTVTVNSREKSSNNPQLVITP